MSSVSLASITVILVILGIAFLVLVNLNATSQDIREKVDQIMVNLYDTVSISEAADIMIAIDRIPGVDHTEYQTREVALESLKEKWGEKAGALDRLQTNPLPNSIIITMTNIEYGRSIVEDVEQMVAVESISYSQDTIDQILRITRILQIVALIIIAALVAVSITVVSNTIKLTVLAREREIVIMRYVGATNWFIRGPFLLEGIVIGIIAAVISSAVIGVVYYYAIERLGLDFAMLMPTGFVPLRFMVENLAIIFVALGVSIGSCGSIISMRRFLEC